MKKLLSIVAIMLAIVVSTGASYSKNVKNEIKPVEGETIQAAQTIQSAQPAAEVKKVNFAVSKDNAWTPTFQLCWNEFIKLTGRDKIEFVGGNTEFVDELNQQNFKTSDLSSDSYYTAVGKQTLKFKKKIQKDIKIKFNEKSDILNAFEFPNVRDGRTDQWFLYSILIKDFKFTAPFDNLDSDLFNKTAGTSYKYFGFDGVKKENKNIKALKNDIQELFYASDDDFALKITDKLKKDEMILYLTNSEESFDDIYNEILCKEQNKNEYTEKRLKEFKEQYKSSANRAIDFRNLYKIPYLNINETIKYDNELADKPIKDKNYESNGKTWVIDKTLQTIKFAMDNKGAKLKSEAAMSVAKTSLDPEAKIILDNYYYFDRPFVIFLKEKGKDKPYFAARINDGKYLVKSK